MQCSWGDWLSWLERRLDMAEVSGSILLSPTRSSITTQNRDRPDMPAQGRGAREMGHRLQAHPSAAAPGTTGSFARRLLPGDGSVRAARRPALTAMSDGIVRQPRGNLPGGAATAP